MNDPVEWAKSVAAAVKEYCGKAIAPILDRLTALEQRQPEKGKDGTSVTAEDVAPIIERAVSDAVAKIPPPKDGESIGLDEVLPALTKAAELKAAEAARVAVSELPRPQDGKSVTVDELRPVIAEIVASIPKPKNGENGKGVTVDEILPILAPTLEAKAAEVARQAVAVLPKPSNGNDGKSVTIDEVLPYFQQAFDKWALDFERRAQDIHTRLLATFEKPRNGTDGEDGLGFDDMRVEHDGERAFTFIFERGEQRKEFKFTVPLVLERGVWKSDRTYERGDAVTGDGSYWIAQKDAPQGKPGQSPDWRLAVKKGRDGKGS